MPVVVPVRYRGQVYVIVSVDANKQVDQWPNGSHDLEYQPSERQPAAAARPGDERRGRSRPGDRRQHVQRQLHGHQPGRRRDAGGQLDRLGLADPRQDPADPGPGRHPADRGRRTPADWSSRPDTTRPSASPFPPTSTPAPITSPPGPTCSPRCSRTRSRSTSTPTIPITSIATTTRRGRSTCSRRLPDLVVTSLTAPDSGQGGRHHHSRLDRAEPEHGGRPAGSTGWIDTVYLTNDPTNPLDPRTPSP